MDLNKVGQKWFAIMVRPRYEFITSKILRNKGYEEFVPTYRTVKQWSDRRKEITVPLFTGYVFCRCNASNASTHALVVTTPGVIRIVGTSNRIVHIEESEIETIRKAVSSEMKVLPFPYINVGDRVCVREGVMAGIEGIFVRHKNRDRLILSVNLIQNSIAVEIPECAVIKVTGCKDGPLDLQHRNCPNNAINGN